MVNSLSGLDGFSLLACAAAVSWSCCDVSGLGSGSGAGAIAADFLRRRTKAMKISAAINGTPTPTPMPIPTFAPVVSPCDVPATATGDVGGDDVATRDVSETELEVREEVELNVGIAVGLNEIVPPGVGGKLPISSRVDFPFGFRINGFEALQAQSGSFCIATHVGWW